MDKREEIIVRTLIQTWRFIACDYLELEEGEKEVKKTFTPQEIIDYVFENNRFERHGGSAVGVAILKDMIKKQGERLTKQYCIGLVPSEACEVSMQME